ncbi:RAD51-associated protein 1 isoform X2 [Bombina bombina]|uniref:RAD51-associated protein 1 isoform X2 n=1 Tax=Bombina bombina TaxID=8345 RepID=UPI00235A51DB|nr:RAD51-associated protein 1 isoform X2 [Bombina bombina]
MDRPMRQKKAVDYSQFGDLDNDDEDFATSSAPPSKKSRVETKKDKKEKPNKKTHKEESLSQQTSTQKRISLDEKLYNRDLEVALALSVENTSAHSESAEECKEVPAFASETRDFETSFSNCSVDTSVLGLDEITSTNEDQVDGRSRRQAASKAIKEQRKILADDSGDEEAEDEFKPTTYDSESDSSISEGDEEFELKSKASKSNKAVKLKTKGQNGEKKVSRPQTADSESDLSISGEDEEFEFKKSKTSKPKKSVKLKENEQKREKNTSKSKSAESSVSPVTIKIKPLPMQRVPVSSPTSVKPVHSSPPVGTIKPKWTPPAPSGNMKNPLGDAVRSPNQGLRLGLSRLARVKPLHPTGVSN